MTADETDEIVDSRPHPIRHAASTVQSWHCEALFWRGVYAQMLGTVGAAFVVYAIAAISGYVSRDPLIAALAVASVCAAVWFVVTIIRVIPVWSAVRPLFLRWYTDPTPENVRAGDLYGSLFFSGMLTLATGLFLLLALFSGAE